VEDIEKFDPDALELLCRFPARIIPVFEEAAQEVIAMTIVPRPDPSTMPTIQVLLFNFARVSDLRDLGADNVSQLVCVRGIVVSSGRPRVKSTRLSIMCRNCRNRRLINCSAGFGHTQLPRTCDAQQREGAACPMDPYIVLPDSTEYMDQQRLKLQETPEMVPTGEMPRHVSLALERSLVGTIKAGTRVTVVGIFSVYQARQRSRDITGGNATGSIRHPYLRVVSIRSENEAAELMAGRFRPEDEEEMHELAKSDDLYAKISGSIAPAIFGSDDIKKAIACQLFGGARKRLPDGMRIRGDINILLLGDPSTAKSQFLKFAIQIAPIGVYTSGKGSSAAGLTASVIRDPSTGEFQLEGGALVLADGGLVCIDECDKMRPADRVAIHEAMEQQTISIAKAGITTILNSRASVLAAANPVFGRYDDMRSAAENIDFATSLLSRFDLIFIVRDRRDETRDKNLAKYVIGVHQSGSRTDSDSKISGDIDIDLLKKYIAYARARCEPRLSAEAAEALKNHYIKVRADMKRQKESSRVAVPITVRQLEAIVRMSESLARMELAQEANVNHVKEAIRLFTVSTYQAATSNRGENVLLTREEEKEARAVEGIILSIVPINSSMSVAVIKRQVRRYKDRVVQTALVNLERRGSLQFIAQNRMAKRIK
jgi:DNA replication licensing factor MCM5